MSKGSEPPEHVNALARGLSVLRAFDRSHLSMTLSEVAVRTDMNRAAARRFLLTLVHEGYVAYDGKYFRLRPAVLDLGYSALASMAFAEIAGEAMDELAEELGETCLAAVLDGRDVVYVARSKTTRLFTLNIDVGDRLPAFCMSTGRMLLSALDEQALDRWLADFEPTAFTEHTVTSMPRLRAAIASAGAAGYSIVDQEYEPGFRSLSVPIHDGSGVVAAALNVCCPSAQATPDVLRERFVPVMRASAARIEALLPEDWHQRRQELVRRAVAGRG